MKLFVSGSSSLRILPIEVQLYLTEEMEKSTEILLGDCYGADYLVQTFLKENHYKNVTVYVAGENVRNCVGSWNIVKIPVPSSMKGRAFYTQKDKAMQEDCDAALALWDGKSLGTGNNINNVRAMGKPVKIWHTTKSNWLS